LKLFISGKKSSGVNNPDIFLHEVFFKNNIAFSSCSLRKGGLILSNSSLQRAWLSQRELIQFI